MQVLGDHTLMILNTLLSIRQRQLLIRNNRWCCKTPSWISISADNSASLQDEIAENILPRTIQHADIFYQTIL